VGVICGVCSGYDGCSGTGVQGAIRCAVYRVWRVVGAVYGVCRTLSCVQRVVGADGGCSVWLVCVHRVSRAMHCVQWVPCVWAYHLCSGGVVRGIRVSISGLRDAVYGGWCSVWQVECDGGTVQGIMCGGWVVQCTVCERASCVVCSASCGGCSAWWVGVHRVWGAVRSVVGAARGMCVRIVSRVMCMACSRYPVCVGGLPCGWRVVGAVYGVRACIVCRVQCSVRSVWWVQCRVQGSVCGGGLVQCIVGAAAKMHRRVHLLIPTRHQMEYT
jgi:hypothetical protein